MEVKLTSEEQKLVERIYRWHGVGFPSDGFEPFILYLAIGGPALCVLVDAVSKIASGGFTWSVVVSIFGPNAWTLLFWLMVFRLTKAMRSYQNLILKLARMPQRLQRSENDSH